MSAPKSHKRERAHSKKKELQFEDTEKTEVPTPTAFGGP
jgi:hypothetical protein